MNTIEKHLTDKIMKAIENKDQELINKYYAKYRNFYIGLGDKADKELFNDVLEKYKEFCMGAKGG